MKKTQRNRGLLVSVLAGATLKETAEHFNISIERVRQIVFTRIRADHYKYWLLHPKTLKQFRKDADILIPKILQ